MYSIVNITYQNCVFGSSEYSLRSPSRCILINKICSYRFVLLIKSKLIRSQITRDVEGDCELSPPLADNKKSYLYRATYVNSVNHEMVILDLLMMWYWHVTQYKGTKVPFYYHGLTLIPAWISNYMPGKVWDEFIYSFPIFNGWSLGFDK